MHTYRMPGLIQMVGWMYAQTRISAIPISCDLTMVSRHMPCTEMEMGIYSQRMGSARMATRISQTVL